MLGMRKEGTDVHGHMNSVHGIRTFANRIAHNLYDTDKKFLLINKASSYRSRESFRIFVQKVNSGPERV